MLRLSSKKRGEQKTFTSLLGYFSFVSPEVILQKDGSFLANIRYYPSDLTTESEELGVEKVKLENGFYQALKDLSVGWLFHIHAVRKKVKYPKLEEYEGNIAGRIFREKYQKEIGQREHFRTEYSISLTYTPRYRENKKLSSFFIQGKKGYGEQGEFNRELEEFIKKVRYLEGLLQRVCQAYILEENELIRFLDECIRGEESKVRYHKESIYVGEVLGRSSFTTYPEVKVGDSYIKSLSFEGVIGKEIGGILDKLHQEGGTYRLNQRFIPLSSQEARTLMRKSRVLYHNMKYSFWDLIKSSLSDQIKGRKDSLGDQKINQVDLAISEVSHNLEVYGYYTGGITLWSKDKEKVDQEALTIKSILDSQGLLTRIEKLNTTESYLGGLPGQYRTDLRRSMVRLRSFTKLVPLSAPWGGEQKGKSLEIIKRQGVLAYVPTRNKELFKCNIFDGEVGHTLILGATGSGKSVLLKKITCLFLRYSQSRVYLFDKGRSMEPLKDIIQAQYIDFDNQERGMCGYNPLRYLKSHFEKVFQWVEIFLNYQGIELDVYTREEVWEALRSLRETPDVMLSHFYTHLKSERIKMALRPYVRVMGGALAYLFDSESQDWEYDQNSILELNALLSYEPNQKGPLLSYLLMMLDISLKGDPTLLILDEAWSFLSERQCIPFLKSWLKELRKKQAAVIFATQSIEDIYQSEIKDTILGSCFTKFILPGVRSQSESSRDFYAEIGLGEGDIEQLMRMEPHRDCLFINSQGKRVIDYSLDQESLGVLAGREL